MEAPRPTVAELGEFALIDRLQAALPKMVTRLFDGGAGIGDDAAIWTPPANQQLVVTTDALVESVHFRLDWTDWESLGHKMLAVNLSDIAAMGATPRIATIVLGLTGRELVADIEALYRGAGRLAEAHGVVIGGGDVVRCPHDVTLSVTVIGSVPTSESILRSGAQAGDLIAVSGTLGASAAGMALIQAGESTSATGSLLKAAHLRPQPRLALGAILGAHGVTAAMDLSDGLLGDLPKILRASGVSADINENRIPVLPAIRALFPDQWRDFAMHGGEDYELLLTIPVDRMSSFQIAAATIGATITAIGEITTGEIGQMRLLRDGISIEEPEGAFDHFGHA